MINILIYQLSQLPYSVRDLLRRLSYGGGSNLTPPSKIHKNAPISLKIGTKVHNYQNSKKKKEKKSDPREGGDGPIFGSAGRFLANF